MSDNAIDTAAVEGATAEVDVTPGDIGDDTGTADVGDDRGAANREAAKYRRQLRDVEAQRDQLGERLAAMQRGQAEALAREHLADGLDEATAKWDFDEIAEIEDDEDDEALSKLTESSGSTPHST